MQKFDIEDWGLIRYLDAWEKQKEYVSQIQKGKRKSTLVFCEHPSVVTVGKNGSVDNLLKTEKWFEENDVDLVWTSRGGDVTLHNPNQIVVYPLFDLKEFKTDLHWFLRELEEVVIRAVLEYGIIGTRVDGLTGVWVDGESKICAMGLHCSRWVTSHGLALNFTNDLEEFSYIVPCGIAEKKVTSILLELQKNKGKSTSSSEIGTTLVKDKLKELLTTNFQYLF